MTYKDAALTPDILAIIRDKKTEKPFSGHYLEPLFQGTYICRGCGVALFHTASQFHSDCGWPSFDGEIQNAIKRITDADGRRTEILCAECDAHLGHVFTGESLTEKNIRHCVNSLAIECIPDMHITKTEEAIIAGGCFWGVQFLVDQLPGILLTQVGYIGGTQANPTYMQVCSHQTAHVEAVRIIFDPQKITYEKIIRYFFEIHDFTQQDGQGPDIGSQYLSRIFYFNDAQRNDAEKIKRELDSKQYHVATEIKPVSTFWPAENYHQHYYQKNNQVPYCHQWTKRF